MWSYYISFIIQYKHHIIDYKFSKLNISMKYGNIFQESNSYIKIANGITAERPDPASNGFMRFNDELGYLEEYNNGWKPVDTHVAHPGFKNNIYYGSPAVDGPPVYGNYFQGGFLYALPFYIPYETSFNRIGFCVTDQWDNPTVKIAIFSNNNGNPDQLLYDVDYVPVSSIGNKEVEFLYSNDVHNKWIWIGLYSTTALNMLSYSWSQNGNYLLGRASPTSYGTIGITSDQFFTNIPSSFPNPMPITNTVPYIWIRNV